ncbi:polar growth protein [Puccinia graminis f. sp. tritici]|uniref:Polar growth protein n=1 Tax=Puccinia graminis f. sp. tritici TaxID=56615 RepID=A0A5B0PBI4_PUCGR|nr:polar growth protein [Puccinia graminis f. sp. tritici]
MPKPEQPKLVTIVYAIHDFQAENPDELSFSAGEAIEVTEKDDLYGDGWWQGRNTKGQFGLFPQAYTLPAASVVPTGSSPSSSKPTPQLTMHETLFEVQNAIDQLHHPSPSTTSLPPPSPLSPDSTNHSTQSTKTPTNTDQHSDEADEDRESTQLNLHSNPAKARAILAQKAQADSQHSHSIVIERLKSASNQIYPNHRTSLNSLVSVPGIGDIELSEESGSEDDDDDDDDDDPKPTAHPSTTRSRSSTIAAGTDRTTNKSNSSLQQRPTSPTHPSAPKLTSQLSSDSSRPTAFKPGPFSAAAIALGLTGSPKEKDKDKHSSFQKGHQPQKPSSSSILSDMGLDLRDHFNLASAPVASTLRMSRESSQFNNLPTFSDLNLRAPNSAPSDGTLRSVSAAPTSVITSTASDDQPPSPQEHLSETIAVPTRNSLATRSQENLQTTRSNSHQRQTSAYSTGSGIFSQQQLSQLPNPSQPIIQDTKTSVSTADSSSAKGSRSRSSSRVEQFVSIEDQPTSPATSTFPSSTGARQGDGSLSSSQSRSNKPFAFGSFSSAFPDQWTVTEVSEWAKVKGLDEFTVGKFIEHEITGDVLLELDVNALKEIDLTAFGRRVRVIKAIEELKKNVLHQKQSQPSPLSPLSDGIHLTSSSIDSSLQPSPLSNPRKEFANNQAVRLSTSAKQDHSTFPYQKAYHPPAELSDREEELAHQSSRDSTSRASAMQSHSKRPSDASGFSSYRPQENENSNSSRDDLMTSSKKLSSGYKRTSSPSGRPRQATFGNNDGIQTNHQRNQSKATNDSSRRSRASSWAPVTETQENSLADTDKAPAVLDEPIVFGSPDPNVDEKPKKVKKKKLGIQKPPGTASSAKNKKNSLESPDRLPASPDTPDRSHDPPMTKSRTSFLGNLRVRKPPPKLGSQSPGSLGTVNNQVEGDPRPSSSSGNPSSMNGRHGRSLFHFGHEKVQGQSQHQIQHLSPLAETKNSISSPIPLDNDKEVDDLTGGKRDGETRTALERIGTPDHMGWMRKKGEKYPTWKLRYFILKGSNLYYLKTQNEIRIKGLIKLAGFKVVMDADVHPGRYGFRIIHDNGSTHLFSADDSKLLRDWMKAMMKATIDRDWIAPVISSCNIRTIPIREAQKMFPPPRPPSPLSRARVQKARLAANPDVLSEKDAAVLMSLQNLQAAPGNRVLGTTPPISPSPHQNSPENALRPRRSTQRPSPEKSSNHSHAEELTTDDKELLRWINEQVRSHPNNKSPTRYEATDFSDSIRNGLVLVRLIESLTHSHSGILDHEFIDIDSHSNNVRGSFIQKDDDFDVFFSIFDYLNAQNIPDLSASG